MDKLKAVPADLSKLSNIVDNDVFENLIENVIFDKYKNYGCGTGFNTRGSFSLSNGKVFDKNVITFCVVMGSSVHICEKITIFDSW